MRITPNSLSVSNLLGSENEQYVIPTYQRRYSWHEQQVWDLIEDVELLENSDSHLLGMIVCLAAHHTAGLNKLELVDGQQRLTTISIILECIREKFEELDEEEDAKGLSRLLMARPHGSKPERKVLLESMDAEEYARLVKNDQSDDDFKNEALWYAFDIVRDWIKDQSTEKLQTFSYRLRNQATVIRLDVVEAKDAFKLFETINNRGLRLSPTDIIKNFLLGNAARFGDQALQTARKSWSQILRHLDSTDTNAFFRYYLMSVVCRRLRASKLMKFQKMKGAVLRSLVSMAS